ncbi:uncharacterized protein LOC141655804 [Silene latifolia]|uniref:uncharacterized protein LOC141655804 n=1 Tax=Silene latifolia TaxID=37657 RepID=UPI003D7887C5
MEINNYPLTCWWNGDVVEEGESISYKGGCETFIIVNNKIKFSDLKSEIHDALEVDPTKFELNVRMKFPSVRGYKLCCLNNDRSLRALWASVCQSKAASMDLYIDLVPIAPSNEITQPSFQSSLFSFTNMITQVKNPNWSSVSLGTNNVDEEGIDCNIEGDEIEGDVQEEDVMLFSEDDDIDVDLISPGLPNSDFTKLHAIDEDYVNSWYKTKDVPYVNGGEFNVGQEFANKQVLREVVISYNVKRNKISKTIESRSHTITYKCGRKPNPCNWYLRATKKNVTSNVFTIVSYKGPHETTCVVKKPSRDHPNLKREFISNAIKPLVEADWGAKVQLLRAAITKEFNFTISYAKAWAAKQKAIADLYGDWEESYAYLPRYLDALKESNPGTVVHFVNKSTHIPNCEQFDRVFWAFGPSIKGFPHCRPIITIDGTHLYGKYNGVLLIAMGVDANEQLYPLCFAIVDKERYNTWSWFLACIRGFITQRQGICVISDRHPGILKAMTEVGSGWEEPFAFHRYCIRHHASNINTMFKDTELKKAFTKTAFQHQLRKFENGMEDIGAINMNAKALLEGIPLS